MSPTTFGLALIALMLGSALAFIVLMLVDYCH